MLGNSATCVAVVVANQNTAELLAHLLFSLCRIARPQDIGSIVVVDGGSTDHSRVLLRALEEQGRVELILNRREQQHGLALNQALDYLTSRARLGSHLRYVLVVDSDTVVLRGDVVHNALCRIREADAGLLGEFQYDALPEGYAHPSAAFIDLHQTFLAQTCRFESGGAPALAMHKSLRNRGIPICDFPIRSDHYVLHVGRSTRRVAVARRSDTGRAAAAAEVAFAPHYHGDPQGPEIHAAFLSLFRREVPKITPESLASACIRDTQLTLDLSSIVPGKEAHS